MSLLDPKRDKTAVQLFDEMAKDQELYILELNKKFRLVVGSSTAWSCAFSDLIHFQFNCPLFWPKFCGGCACKHILVVGLHESASASGGRWYRAPRRYERGYTSLQVRVTIVEVQLFP